MSKPPIQDTRRHLGELGAMASRIDADERRILESAEKCLAATEKLMREHRAAALAGDDDASNGYQDAVAERGRLQQVIAQSRANLPEHAVSG